MKEYKEFIRSKHIRTKKIGFEIDINALNKNLFDWQKIITKWAINSGCAGIFERPGLGKTIQQLEWANQIQIKTGGTGLIISPLAVSSQTVREGLKFGIEVNKCRTQKDVVPKSINITNYEMIDNFDCNEYVLVVLDEASILKSFMGKIKTKLIESFRNTPYKLVATATPSPNITNDDPMELLNQADFLGIMPSNEALARWFINDTMNFGKYRLIKHAEDDFWNWVASWAVCIEKPSDIGFKNDGFDLPELKRIEHIVKIDNSHNFNNGKLFKEPEKLNATSLYRELRETAHERAKYCADIVNSINEGCVVWCNTNKEADLLNKFIKDSVNVQGSMPIDKKESALESFTSGNIKVMITKPSMCGFGLNWQHICKQFFVGLSYSYEQLYQAECRLHRFGQKNNVESHIIMTPAERQVYRRVMKKGEQNKAMRGKMARNISQYNNFETNQRKLNPYIKTSVAKGKNYKLILGDACIETKKIKSDSIDFTIFSPPFSSLYIYSDSMADMGNCKNDDEFFVHFNFLIPELYRITRPGRLCAIHCKDLVDYKGRDGRAGLRDFPGQIIIEMEKGGWKYHSRVTIWKDPVIEMQRTKAHGLLHKQTKKDSSFSRQGLPDYLIVFRKWTHENENKVAPVARNEGFECYHGEKPPHEENPFGKENAVEHEKTGYSIHVWQRYASPVWFDIAQTKCLNTKMAKESKDEKHICPLQEDVIKRAVHLWTNEGETVFTPFAGIGSELYYSNQIGRKAIGIELKEKYFLHAKRNLESLEKTGVQMELFN